MPRFSYRMAMCDTNNTLTATTESNFSLDVQDVCLIIISTVGVILNSFLLCGICLPKTCSAFVRNLALVDLCTAFISFLWVFRKTISRNPAFVQLLITLSWLFVFISFLTVFVIAVQRYVAVAYALWSHSVMKNHLKLFRMLSVSTWVISILCCSARFYLKWSIVSFILTIIFEVIILSTIVLYFMIFASFRRYRFGNQSRFSDQSRLKLHLEKETKLTKTVFWVTGVLIIGVLPYIVLLQLGASHHIFQTLDVLECNKTFATLSSYWVILEMLAFSLNPVIYLSRYQVNRRKLNRIRQTLLQCFPKRNFRVSHEGNETQTNETC